MELALVAADRCPIKNQRSLANLTHRFFHDHTSLNLAPQLDPVPEAILLHRIPLLLFLLLLLLLLLPVPILLLSIPSAILPLSSLLLFCPLVFSLHGLSGLWHCSP
jgi:hypothetical protein